MFAYLFANAGQHSGLSPVTQCCHGSQNSTFSRVLMCSPNEPISADVRRSSALWLFPFWQHVSKQQCSLFTFFPWSLKGNTDLRKMQTGAVFTAVIVRTYVGTVVFLWKCEYYRGLRVPATVEGSASSTTHGWLEEKKNRAVERCGGYF